MSGNHALAERIEFLGIDHQARETLKSIQPLIRTELKSALASFYDKVRRTPATRGQFKNDAHIEGASRAQERHWDLIAQAEFNDDYAKAVRKVGQTHAQIGLEPRWYIGGYALISDHLIRAIIKAKWPKGMMGRGDKGEAAGQAVASFVKAAMLDMDLAISTYLEAIEDERKRQETIRIANEANQAAVVAALGAALSKLANGDLASRLSSNVSPDFQQLKDDFNGAVAALEQAMGQMSSTTSSIGVGTDEIGAAADDLSRRTEQQAATLEETAAALEEITTTVRRTAAGAKQASEVVTGAKAEAERSGAVVGEAVSAMGEIEKSSQQISQIIGVIDEIAFQTNLLALNAGVEAARAGDAGKGFAVVASEVRALAQRSAEAAKEIKALISASTQQVETGVALVGQTGQALQGIVAKVAEIDGLVTEIASSAQEQSVGLHQVNIAINQMDQVTQQNAAMVEETTAATHSLKGQTSELTRLMAGFRVSQRPGAVAPARTRPEPARATRHGPGGGAARKLAPAPDAEGWQEF
jgi:methyl-accepting chemotaxis protein